MNDPARDYQRILALPRARRRNMARAYKRLAAGNGDPRAWSLVWPLFRRPITETKARPMGADLFDTLGAAIKRARKMLGS